MNMQREGLRGPATLVCHRLDGGDSLHAHAPNKLHTLNLLHSLRHKRKQPYEPYEPPFCMRALLVLHVRACTVSSKQAAMRTDMLRAHTALWLRTSGHSAEVSTATTFSGTSS